MPALTAKDRRLLYSRYHSLKTQAAKKNAAFYWEEAGLGFDGFCADIEQGAPADYTPETYTIRFDKRLVADTGYSTQAMIFRPFSQEVLNRKHKRKEEKRIVQGLPRSVDLATLTSAACHLTMLLQESEGTPDDLVEEAFLIAENGD